MVDTSFKSGTGVSSDQFNPFTDSGWLWTGDNLAIMTGLDDEIVDLIYLDPPFNSNANYINIFKTADQQIEMQFKDIWTPTDDDEFVLRVIGERRPNLPAYINAVGGLIDKKMRAYLIFMGIRLLEMHRLLKPTGSIYLHCDHTASHYLKNLMDGIFGRKYFRNEIVWSYRTGGNSKYWYARKHDIILFYSKTDKYTFNQQKEKSYNRDYKPYNFKNVKEYQDEEGKWYTLATLRDVWEMNAIGRSSSERTGYPTQKPLKLLDRIIDVSSNEGDLVFDPFAGCATTVISANRSNRRWISCDIAQSSVPILKKRINEDYASEGPQLTTPTGSGFITNVMNPDDLPTSSYDEQVRNSQKLRKIIAMKALDTDQIEYKCNGCGLSLPIRLLEIDHLVPKSRGGDDSETNRILLCGYCNKSKGHKTWNEWKSESFKQCS